MFPIFSSLVGFVFLACLEFHSIRVANVTTSLVPALSTTPLPSTPLKVPPNATIIVDQILVHDAEPPAS
jgi:hypothetical protein